MMPRARGAVNRPSLDPIGHVLISCTRDLPIQRDRERA